MTDKTGGPAFPVSYSREDFIQEGATLRDMFAAKAMQGILSNHCMIDNVTGESAKWVCFRVISRRKTGLNLFRVNNHDNRICITTGNARLCCACNSPLTTQE